MMKIRFKNQIEISDAEKVMRTGGAILKLDKMEIEIIKMFDQGVSFFPIKMYITKRYRINKTEYTRRLEMLFERLEKLNCIEN